MAWQYSDPITEAEKRRHRLAMLVLVSVSILLLIWVLTNDRGEPARSERRGVQVEVGEEGSTRSLTPIHPRKETP